MSYYTTLHSCTSELIFYSLTYHDCIAGGGHQGHERTYVAIRAKYYWPDTEKYSKTCVTCHQSKDSKHRHPILLRPFPVETFLEDGIWTSWNNQ